MRKTVTIPAAGNTKRVDITGSSLIIESAGNYQDAPAVPTFDFSAGRKNNPIYARSVYGNDGKSFDSISINGTAESASDEVVFYSVDECLKTDLNISISETVKSIAGTTKTKVASDAAKNFSKLELSDSEGRLPKRLYIWVVGGATRGINYAFNTAPSQGYLPNDAMYYDNDQRNNAANTERSSLQPLEIVGIDWILSFQFIASVLGETPTVVWTGEY